MSPNDCKELRRLIGTAALQSQIWAKQRGYSAEDTIPEIIAALLSLAAYVTNRNAMLPRDVFLSACEKAADEQWKEND